jgi:hypothetical protein
MSELSAALARLEEAAAAAAVEHPNDDTATVQTQARAALEACNELALAAEGKQSERALHILHKLNNKLTGSMSLTMLAREDLPEGSPLDATLARVEQMARSAASAARDVANAVKSQAAQHSDTT